MRNVIYSINLSLDGCCDHTKFGGADDELFEYFTQLMQEADTAVYGRITYELMVPFWPDVAKSNSGSTKAMNDFARALDAIEKTIVFSRSLQSIDRKNTRLVRSNLQDEIRQLKQEQGRSILLDGVTLSSQLLGDELIDEYRMVIHPVIVGKGRRLFEEASLQERVPLRLVGTRVFKSGCVALHYLKDASLRS
jgi:dihydrofolate reductase